MVNLLYIIIDNGELTLDNDGSWRTYVGQGWILENLLWILMDPGELTLDNDGS